MKGGDWKVEEHILIKRIQNGDKAAMTGLISSWYQPVFAFFYKNTGDYHISKDLTQEVFIKTAAGISKYKPKTPFKNWLFAIASNHLKNYYRTLSRRPVCVEISEEQIISDKEMENITVKTDIKTALAKLPFEQRVAVVLRYYNEFSIKDIAKITETKETTVKARIRYGLEKLKIELEGYNK